MTQLMEVNREGSGLDQEQMAGRFTLTRYILYLLPVIGFIGTVEGISKALMNISKVLPMVKNLDGFLTNLTSVTAALQIAFDSTLLALVPERGLDAGPDAWSFAGRRTCWRGSTAGSSITCCRGSAPMIRWPIDWSRSIGPQLDEMGNKLALVLEPAVRSLHEQAEKLGESLRVPIAQFAREVERLPAGARFLQTGCRHHRADRRRSRGDRLGERVAAARRGRPGADRDGARADADAGGTARGDQARARARPGASIDSLAGSWSAAYERSSRATQEQLARSLTSLKDALELLNVSMEQGNALYRNIVKKLFDERTEAGPHRAESIRVA